MSKKKQNLVLNLTSDLKFFRPKYINENLKSVKKN